MWPIGTLVLGDRPLAGNPRDVAAWLYRQAVCAYGFEVPIDLSHDPFPDIRIHFLPDGFHPLFRV